MKTRLWASLLGTVLVVGALLVGNVAAGNSPQLGIDLQGGVSVILEPTEPATQDDLIVIRDLIRDELERSGIAEPDVRTQGNTIVVDLPGVRDTEDALSRVDVSGVVELRPVLFTAECQPIEPTTLDPGVDGATITLDDNSTVSERRVPSRPDELLDGPVVSQTDEPVVPTPVIPTTAGAELLPTRDGVIVCVGATQGTGEVFERQSAEATLDQTGWGVAVGLRGGEGRAVWNNLAAQCFNGAPTCPRTNPNSNGQIAIVLDSVVQSAPSVNTTNFGDSVAITGSFSQEEARDLARILNRGAFPVEVEAQEVEVITASAGGQALDAAIIAGLIGVAFVLVFLLAYYRWLALVILAGLTVWGSTVYVVATLVSEWTNFSLSLAGVTGIIVAVGVTVDSYVVFFERMKDEIRNGRTLKNAAPRSFAATWRTIWTADVVSVIGAAILFALSVGNVRGFALFLGITTLCDLFVCFFFTRPAVVILARSNFMVGKRAFGLEVAQ